MAAEMNRTLRQAEAARQELEEALERKEEAFAMVDKLSQQIVWMQKDSEQKEKVLSAMLRKLKLDTAEKQMLVKEVKISKAKKKQAELEMERWRNMWESSRNKNSRNMHSVDLASLQNRRPELVPVGSFVHNNSLNLLPESDYRKEESSTTSALKCHVHLSIDENGEAALAMEDYQQLQDWVRKETEKYATILEQKHYPEIEAFTEQLRQKDEKLAASQWQKESYRSGGSRDLQNGRTMEQSEMLGRLLEETFQLQRYIVATGQNLMEMQSRIDPSLNGATRFDESIGFNIKLFAGIVN